MASKKDWTQVVANLEVYAYTGEKVTQNPRHGVEYRDRVVAELGFGPEQRERRPDLSEGRSRPFERSFTGRLGLPVGKRAADYGACRATRHTTDRASGEAAAA